jgi:hypothetical protein
MENKKIRKVQIAAFLCLAVLSSPAVTDAGIKDIIGQFHGFEEVMFGYRYGDGYTKHPDYNVFENRFQLKLRSFPEAPSLLHEYNAVFNFKGDFTIDGYYDGKTDFDLRELNLTVSPSDKWDMKLGRQILTWGTGELLFINEVFPKDYVSFFTGRSLEYLKAPVWALKTSYFGEHFWLDTVIMPYFEPNITPSGDRLSFYDVLRRQYSGRDSDWFKREVPHQAENIQYALRLYHQEGSLEWALYGYRGFYLSPVGFKNPLNAESYYPRLDVYGASVRGPFLNGIGNIEVGYYNSRDDVSGTNRLIPNSSVKAMAGYSRDFSGDVSLGFQYFCERIVQYHDYRKNLLPGDLSSDEFRHLITLSFTKQFRNQTVTWDNFIYFSPSDEDGYVRMSLSRTFNDKLTLTLGANYFFGNDDYTEFGQFEGNSNVYTRARYIF